MYKIALIFFYCSFIGILADETDYNIINSDGSYSFGLSNDDIGAHYHSGTGSVNNIVRGRYGSRNPANSRLEETVYTAGPRGFRARGPNIHRKMDLSQVPRGPIGSPDDPLADPYDVPTYGFGFRTSDYQRREDADPAGHVTGLYSYLDDVGEKHTVRYAAGAGTGYEVANAVPDQPSIVRYSAPLYKTARNVRGRISYERGPGGQYKFISSGPDQRRSESTGSDGITRGSYSYLDDKGVQRTVQYIAGAGIGYRIVQSTTGSGTHLVPRPAIPEFGVFTPQSNDISDDDGTGFKTAESGSILPSRNPSGSSNSYSGSSNSYSGSSNSYSENNKKPITFEQSGSGRFDDKQNSGNRVTDRIESVSKDRDHLHRNRDDSPVNRGSRPGSGSRGSTNFDNQSGQFDVSNSNKYNSVEDGSFPNRGTTRFNGNKSGSSSSSSRPTSFNTNHEPEPPFVSNNAYDLDKNRNNDWTTKGRDSTIVKNVGDWYVGLPPGAAVRAHVQNIDLLPLGGRAVPSPSEALRLDEKHSRQY